MFGALEYMAFLVVAGALLGLITGSIAERKGRSFTVWWLFGGLLFIVALPMALIMEPDRNVLEQRQARLGGLQKCPFCAEYIRPEAIVCKHCGRDLPRGTAP